MNNGNAESLCLSLLSKCDTLRAATQVHAFAFKTGLADNPFLAGKLLLRCAVAISGALSHARRLLRHFPDPDAFMYNTLIRGLSESEAPLHALATFKELHRREASLSDSFTFAFALKAAASFGSLRVGSQLHCRAFVHGLDSHIFVATTLVSFYAKCEALELARKVFDGISEPNAVAWNAILMACMRRFDVGYGEALFEEMRVRNSTSWNILIAGYVAAGELERARTAFRKMPVRDEVSWSTIIVGFAQNGCLGDAFLLFKEIFQMGLRPNEASLTGVLSAAAQAGAFEFARVVHCFAEKVGFMWMVSVNNVLLDAYSKCGNVSMARLLFERMPEKKSIVSWSSMISALAMHGHGEEAIELFDKMECFGIRPDGITYVSILYSCSHAGLVEEGHRYFSKMIYDDGIEPTLEHYGCMVDLYGRAGKVEKAYRFVCEMPVTPNAVIWRTLLGACKLHGNVELAEKVKEKLSRIEPINSGDHILLSNIYASAGKWKDVASVRQSMSEQRINKTPGWSVVEVNKLSYSFVASSDKGNEAAEEAWEKLKEVMRRLRVEGGYVPEVGSVLYDIADEEKEESMSRHSEKLAVAFGMARLQKGEIIRIVKNLRICSDCHTVMKLISKLYGIEIVVRDRSRFHTFREGSCSCGDYW